MCPLKMYAKRMKERNLRFQLNEANQFWEDKNDEITSFFQQFNTTRQKPGYGRQSLDWIVGQGYSFEVFS